MNQDVEKLSNHKVVIGKTKDGMKQSLEELAKTFVNNGKLFIFEGLSDRDSAVEFQDFAKQHGHAIDREHAYKTLTELQV